MVNGVNIYCSYEATSSRKSRSLAKELTTGAVASVFLGFGSLFLLLASGVYVWDLWVDEILLRKTRFTWRTILLALLVNSRGIVNETNFNTLVFCLMCQRVEILNCLSVFDSSFIVIAGMSMGYGVQCWAKCWEDIFEGSLNLTIETGCRGVHNKAIDRGTDSFSPSRELDSKIRQVNFAISLSSFCLFSWKKLEFKLLICSRDRQHFLYSSNYQTYNPNLSSYFQNLS